MEENDLIELIYDLFVQACRMPDDMYDHQFISTYEDAQRFLISIGRIKQEDCRYEA